MFSKMIILTIKLYYHFYQLKQIDFIILNLFSKWEIEFLIFSVFLEHCCNAVTPLKIA